MTFQETLFRSRIAFHVSLTNRNEIRLCCPFCPEQRGVPDTSFAFHVNIKNGAGHCWHSDCDWKSHKAAFYLLRRLIGNGEFSGFDEVEQPKLKKLKLPEDFTLLNDPQDLFDQRARDYLLKRGVTHAQIREKHIGVCYTGKYAYRILFPITDPLGMHLYGFSARDFTGKRNPKYLTNPGPKHLYNYDRTAETAVFSEGVFKALRIEQITGFNSVSTLGHSLTEKQLEEVQKSKYKRIILWSDPDKVGRKGTVQIADKLLEEWSGLVSVIYPIPETPADELSFDELSRIMTDSVKTYSWIVRQKIIL